MISSQVIGAGEVAAALVAKAIHTNTQAVEKAHESGAALVADARSRAPRLSGFLADTIYYEVIVEKDGVSIAVGSEADYDFIQEYGSVHLAPNPFYGPAADKQEGEFGDAIEGIAGVL